MKHIFSFITVVLVLGVSNFGHAQDFYRQIQKLKIYDLTDEASNLEVNSAEKLYLDSQIDLIRNVTVDSARAFKLKPKRPTDSILRSLMIGDFYLYKTFTEDSLALNRYITSYDLATAEKDTILIVESIKKILTQLYKSRKSMEVYPYYLAEYKKYLYDDNENATYQFYFYNHKGSSEQVETIADLQNGQKIAENTENGYLKGKYNQIIGLQHQYFNNQLDSALFHFEKAKKYLSSKPYKFFNVELFGIYGNIGLTHQRNSDFLLAQKHFKLANAVDIPKYRYIEKVKLNELLSENAKKLNNADSAYYYLQLRNKFADTLNEYNKAATLNEINTKYQTEKKEKENLELKTQNQEIENKRLRNRNLFIATLIGLISVLAIGTLGYKNINKKKQIAMQEKELQTQKLDNILKNQELNSIDAMIAGQEKERQRIANDLHDDLGSVMANVKLHFNALRENNSDELSEKTNKLIDEAYNKIRTLAHAKNSGVMAKEGLLVAIKNMAEKISATNKIAIEVKEHGLIERLENSLELAIFRIIQELTTNILKHAAATEASIYLTQYEESLNIMVEDNGKGFRTKGLTDNKNGMGLKSIDKRVDHLKGEMTIESEIGKGTSIIIDIPI